MWGLFSFFETLTGASWARMPKPFCCLIGSHALRGGVGLSVFLIEYDVFPIHFCASRARYVATAGATCGHLLLP